MNQIMPSFVQVSYQILILDSVLQTLYLFLFLYLPSWKPEYNTFGEY